MVCSPDRPAVISSVVLVFLVFVLSFIQKQSIWHPAPVQKQFLYTIMPGYTDFDTLKHETSFLCSYLEIAILRCMHFLEKDPPLASFQRLTMMMRGLSDPLASAYAHLYLARHGQALLPSDTGFAVTFSTPATWFCIQCTTDTMDFHSWNSSEMCPPVAAYSTWYIPSLSIPDVESFSPLCSNSWFSYNITPLDLLGLISCLWRNAWNLCQCC